MPFEFKKVASREFAVLQNLQILKRQARNDWVGVPRRFGDNRLRERISDFDGLTAVRRFSRYAPPSLAISARQNPAENVGRGRTGGGRGTGIQRSPNLLAPNSASGENWDPTISMARQPQRGGQLRARRAVPAYLFVDSRLSRRG